MDIDKMISAMTPEQAHQIVRLAKLYTNDLPEPDWRRKEGHWERATTAGIIDGSAPESPMRRDEVIAVLGRTGQFDAQ